MKKYFLFLAVMLSACGGSTPGQSEPIDAGGGGGGDGGGPVRACQTAADCDDGVDCTTDSCGADDKCVWVADHTMCDNGDMCDGVEQCAVELGCQAGDVPEPTRECRLDVEPRVVLGQYHSCALDRLGYLLCWGSGFNGQLGYGEFGETANIGETTDRLPSLIGPVGTPNGETAPLRYVISAALGTDHTCALLNDGGVLCWGSHTEGQLGYGDLGDANVDVERPKLAAPQAMPVNIGGKAVSISSLGKHTCVLLDNGKVRCWGESGDGALGYPVSEPPGGGMVDPRLIIGDDETPADVGDVDVGGLVAQLSVGSQHTCVVLDDGSARCWGNGDSGRLGYGNVDSVGDQEVPAAAGPLNMGGTVKQIAAGGSHTCALMESGAVRCWGRGNEGQLGYGTVDFNGDALLGDDSGETPAEIGDVEVGGTVVQIVAGGQHTCALLDTGSVRCWGDAARGALGHSNLARIGDNETPASAGDVNLGAKAVKIAAGGFHTCALLETGNVRC